MAMPSPFELTVSGKSTIPLPAERGIIDVSVASSGPNKATVSDEVISTSKHIESMLEEYSAVDDSPEAKQEAALAHWSKSSLSSTSSVKYDNDNKVYLPRAYQASVKFDVRFKDFKALGVFGTQISSLAHVEVKSINWILTDLTEKSYRSQLRREAALDAKDKVNDYCEVLGCSNIRPVELKETYSQTVVPSSRMRSSHVAGQSALRFARLKQAKSEQTDRSEDLEFRPQEVHMKMEVTIRFHADHIQGDQTRQAKNS